MTLLTTLLDFSDPGEEVVSYTSTQIGWETSTFQVPATTAAGIIRMRVSMKNGSPAQTPCEIFALGEVEDYTVNISSITGIQGQESSSNISVFQIQHMTFSGLIPRKTPAHSVFKFWISAVV